MTPADEAIVLTFGVFGKSEHQSILESKFENEIAVSD